MSIPRRINAWMEERTINGKPAIIRMFCKGCGAEVTIEVFRWPEDFQTPAIKALRRIFDGLHRDCRHLRVVKPKTKGTK